jgi:hypothetical protein
MSDQEIALELQEIFNRQQTKLEQSQTVLPKVLQIVESSQKTSEKLQISLGMLSKDSKSNQETLTGLTTSFQSFSRGMEKEMKSLKVQNKVLLYTVAALVVIEVVKAFVSAPP